MANCAIVGINWGDEGKGRMVDYLTDRFDVVVRYQGGGNAGHTVVNDKGKFALHLLPSGIFREGVVNILGNGVALDCENLYNEIETLRAAGVAITPENLKVSERASLLLPWHRELDALEEARLKDKKYGSTKQGIAPFYSDKYQKKTVLAGELLHPEHLKAHLAVGVDVRHHIVAHLALALLGHGVVNVGDVRFQLRDLPGGDGQSQLVLRAGERGPQTTPRLKAHIGGEQVQHIRRRVARR